MQNAVVNGNGRSYVVALPDNDAAASIADRLGGPERVLASHVSGRPLLVGTLSGNRLISGSADETCVSVVGQCAVTQEEMNRYAARASAPTDFSRVQLQCSGSFLTFGSYQGNVYASGQALETRRLWWCSIGENTVISDRADVLAELADLAFDETAIALRLLPAQPHPIDQIGLWSGVQPLPGDQALLVGQDGEARRITWWNMPSEDVDLQNGAVAFRDALEKAVTSRTAGNTEVVCDLSGGLDSTPICYFAAASSGSGIVARTLFHPDPGGREDLAWAKKALTVMPNVREHLVKSTDEFVDFYEGVDEVNVVLDEPTQAITAGPRIMALLSEDAQKNAAIHLNGLGGDHILRGVAGWEHTLARSHPLLAWRRSRSEHIPAGTSVMSTLRQLSDRRSYRAWLADGIAKKAKSLRPPGVNDWSSPLALPEWLSADARETVVKAVRSLLSGLDPLHPTVAGHSDIYFARDAAKLVRGTGQLGNPFGVAYEAPLLDDRVVEAAFRVRRTERDNPLEWKPLMKSAMRGILPKEYLMRTSKVGGGAQSVRGYLRHHDVLVGLVEESGLLDGGLIDRTAFLNSTRPDRWEPPSPEIHNVVNLGKFILNQRRTTPVAA